MSDNITETEKMELLKCIRLEFLPNDLLADLGNIGIFPQDMLLKACTQRLKFLDDPKPSGL